MPNQSHLELDVIFSHASIGIAFTLNKVFTRCNPTMERTLGFAPGELNGVSTAVLFQTPQEYALFANEVRHTLALGRSMSLTWDFKNKAGQTVTCKVSATPVNPNPIDEGAVWLFEDITDEVHKARELSQTTTVLAAVMDNAPVGILFTKDRAITRFNNKFAEMFAFGETSPLGYPGRALYATDEDYAEIGRLAAPLLSQGKPFIHETRMARQDGTHFWASMVAYVLNPLQSSEGTVWLITDRSTEKQQQETIRNALFENKVILDNVDIGIVFLKNRVVQRCNQQAEIIFGYAPGTMAGETTRGWYLSESEFQEAGEHFYLGPASDHARSLERLYRRANGDTFWGRLTGRVFDKNNPLDGGSILVIEDTSARHLAEAALRNATNLMGAIFNSANVSIISTDTQGTISLINDTAQRWLGYTAEEVVGKETPAIIHDREEVFARAAELTRELGTPVAPGFEVFVAKAALQGTDEYEWTYIHKNGRRFPVHLTISALRDKSDTITGYIEIGIDITDRRRADQAIQQAQEDLEQRVAERTLAWEMANRKLQEEVETRSQMEDEMRRMAHFDALTGLPNRNLLNDRIEQAIAMARRNGHKVGVFFIDLDHFKTINDTLGHHIGDLLLGQVASRMSFMLRATDTLGRLGGDEFLLLAPAVEDAQNLNTIAEKLIEVLTQAITIQSHILHVTPSIGICCYPEHGTDRETLMRNADTAMYFAKASGRNNFKFYTESLNVAVDNRFQVENALRYALSQEELSVHYQPLMDNRSQKIFGVEALLRWNNKSLGAVSPAQFIPIAEDSGLIIPIGAWVLREACLQVKHWRDTTGSELMLAVNLSPQQFRQANLASEIAQILSETGFPPAALELEITESSLMHNVTEVLATLSQLVQLGLRLAIDDFGTGYSSLSYLRHFPVHKLKIDQSFIRDMTTDPRAVGIVENIIALARTLRLDVIAEGVETPVQQSQLSELGCHYMQGYLFSKPLPGEAMQARLTNC
jgi:diguanylate cyclase (GGDEF)-like protein/PAS domain S-box-containing protein